MPTNEEAETDKDIEVVGQELRRRIDFFRAGMIQKI